MQVRLFLVIFLLLCLSGCATTRKEYNTQLFQLQSRINSLESDLRERDESIYNLKNKLERIESPTLKSQDNDVADISTKQVQIALKNAGFYKGSIDGKIGPKTKEAIKAFQKDNNIRPDGIVGKKTRLYLKQYLKP
jgi:murein L,D-transpeptidase YcbB/YkuD